MATTYRRTNTISDLTGGADFDKAVLDPASDATGSQSISIAAASTEESYGYTDVGVPGTDGVTGDYTVEVEVTAGDTNVQIAVRLFRVNSSGANQATSAASAEQTANAGTLSFSFTAIDLGTWAAGDRLKVGYLLRNSNAHSAKSVTINHGGANNEVVAPWTTGASPTRGLVSWAEAEAPFVLTRGLISWAEIEAPLAPTRGQLSWAELEVPSAPATPTRGLVSWVELETPLVPTRGLVSWTELETPLTPTRGLVSWAEVEAPLAPTRGLVSWVELEAPSDSPSPTRGFVSWAELEAPLVPTRGRLSWAELETPTVPTRGLVSWAEAEVPTLQTRGLISWAEQEVPGLPDPTRGLISWSELQVADASQQVSHLPPYVVVYMWQRTA